ncbi:MAG: ATP-binding protein, partial [Finegoldia magna]|nr:ATP-binding protein [Finegoldia magna]
KNKIEVSAEELMGQFVRGERSRHSEGSGLGLYIAKNLIELLGGTSKISIDEDRFVYEINFKVTRKKKIDK